MEKNVRVVDENQNDYGATWHKRAGGLVKHGRARWISDDTICLTRPPDIKISEENKMTDTMTAALNADITEKNETEASERMTLDYVLKQIENITQSTEHIKKALQNLDSMSAAAGPGDVAGASKADAIAKVVECREATNQQLLQFYIRMYDELRPNSRDKYITELLAIAKGDDDTIDEREAMLNTLSGIIEKLK